MSKVWWAESGWSDESGRGMHIIQTAIKAGLTYLDFFEDFFFPGICVCLRSTFQVDQQVLSNFTLQGTERDIAWFPVNTLEFTMGMIVGTNINLSHSYFLPDTFKHDGFDSSLYISKTDALEHHTKETMSWVLWISLLHPKHKPIFFSVLMRKNVFFILAFVKIRCILFRRSGFSYSLEISKVLL